VNLGEAPWSAYKESLRRCLSGELDHATEREKRSAVEDTIRNSSAAAAFVAMQPFAVVDSFTITPIHYKMVKAIARIHGHETDVKDVKREFFKPLGKKIFGRHAALAGAKAMPLIPVVPHLFGVSIAYALTATLGELSDRYFGSRRTTSPERLVAQFEDVYREQYEHVYKQKRNEVKAMWGSRRRFGALQVERRETRMTEDEYDRRVEELLVHR
jgi:uncharacterized protein (DUF697 family)